MSTTHKTFLTSGRTLEVTAAPNGNSYTVTLTGNHESALTMSDVERIRTAMQIIATNILTIEEKRR